MMRPIGISEMSASSTPHPTRREGGRARQSNARQPRVCPAARGHPPDRPLPVLRLPFLRPLLLRRFFWSAGGPADCLLRRCGGKVLAAALAVRVGVSQQLPSGHWAVARPPVRFPPCALTRTPPLMAAWSYPPLIPHASACRHTHRPLSPCCRRRRRAVSALAHCPRPHPHPRPSSSPASSPLGLTSASPHQT